MSLFGNVPSQMQESAWSPIRSYGSSHLLPQANLNGHVQQGEPHHSMSIFDAPGEGPFQGTTTDLPGLIYQNMADVLGNEQQLTSDEVQYEGNVNATDLDAFVAQNSVPSWPISTLPVLDEPTLNLQVCRLFLYRSGGTYLY
jgi:hypothetical protein